MKEKKCSRFASQNTKKKTQKKLWITKHFLLDKRHDDDFMNKLCAFLHHIFLQTLHLKLHEYYFITIYESCAIDFTQLGQQKCFGTK